MNELVPEIRFEPEQRRVLLGAMRTVAEQGAPLSEAGRQSLRGAAVHVLSGAAEEANDATVPTEAALRAALGTLAARRFAAQLLAVMALVDGTIVPARLERAVAYARALGVDDDYLNDLIETARRHINWIVADMSRRNAASIRGIDVDADFQTQFHPYDAVPDPALAARFHALRELPAASFGRAFYDQYEQNHYPFPGERGGLSMLFGVPHDSTHILSGYGTSAQGELLVSTFTAAMHRREGMAGHILPVIYSWHLGIEFNPLAGSTTGAFDGDKFWRAWQRGAAVTMDTFGPAFDFWSLIEAPIAELRTRFAIPALDVQHSGDGNPRPVRPYSGTE